ncbi:MAG: hypothetical protein ABR512_07250 [Desulfopila sp.]
MKQRRTVVSIALMMILAAPFAQANEARIGGGANYWIAVDDIDVDHVDENGFSFFGSYQYWMGPIGLEANLEFTPDKYGENAFSPQAFVLFGSAIYAGAGIGIEYLDGDFAEEPFFALRAGLNLEIVPDVYWDIYGLYRLNDTAELGNEATDIDSDTVFLGSAVRLAF